MQYMLLPSYVRRSAPVPVPVPVAAAAAPLVKARGEGLLTGASLLRGGRGGREDEPELEPAGVLSRLFARGSDFAISTPVPVPFLG